MLKRLNLICKPDNDDGGDSGETKTPPPAQAESASATATEEEGDSNLDDLGYEIPGSKASETGKETKSDDKKTKEKNPEPAKLEDIKDPSSGYGKDPVKLEEVKEDAPPPEAKKVDLGFEVDVKDLPAAEAEKIQEFAKKNALTKEATQALIDLRKSEVQSQEQAKADFVKKGDRLRAEQKASWDKELREDPTFGKENFAHNVFKVEKVLSQVMTHTKKLLTERKSVLPPYVMRDLAKMHDLLYEKEALVNGDVVVGDEDSSTKTKDDEIKDFYT